MRFLIKDQWKLSVAPSLVAEATIPVNSLQQGFRHVRLNKASGEPSGGEYICLRAISASGGSDSCLRAATLFVHVSMSDDIEFPDSWWIDHSPSGFGLLTAASKRKRR